MTAIRNLFLAAILLPGVAVAGDLDRLLGAAAGAAVGSTIGKGEGRTIAMAAGAIIGAKLADDSSGDGDHSYYVSRTDRDFYNMCKRQVPPEYARNRGAKRAWVEGCVNRMLERQAELEREAYEDGASEDYHHYHHR